MGASSEEGGEVQPDIPVIDLWAPLVPSAEIMHDVLRGFPRAQYGYLRVFLRAEPTAEGVRAALAGREQNDAEIVASLDRAGVRLSLITGFDEASTSDTTFVSNEAIAHTAARHPERFLPFAGCDILRGAEALDELDYWICERGFRGLSLRPFMIGLPADDRRYYPFYAKCVELGVPVSMHASANWTTSRPSDLGHPRHFDQVACDFPELRLVLSHAGYPWVLEACLLAWKHPNVWLELGAHRPRYFTAPGAGWEPLLRFGRTVLAHKVLWGSGAFLLGRPLESLVSEMQELPLPPEILERWLWRNAAELLGLELDPTSPPGAGA